MIAADAGYVIAVPLSALLLGCGAAGYLALSRKLAQARRMVESTHAMVVQVDRAVNGKPMGEETMVAQVQDLHDREPAQEDADAVLPLLRQLASDVAALKAQDKT